MSQEFKKDDKVYIIENNRFIREAVVVSCSAGLYLIRFPDSGGGIKVKEHRLFHTKEEAEKGIK